MMKEIHQKICNNFASDNCFNLEMKSLKLILPFLKDLVFAF